MLVEPTTTVGEETGTVVVEQTGTVAYPVLATVIVVPPVVMVVGAGQ